VHITTAARGDIPTLLTAEIDHAIMKIAMQYNTWHGNDFPFYLTDE